MGIVNRTTQVFYLTVCSSVIPDYWLPRPEFELSDEVRLELETLYVKGIWNGEGDWLSAPLPVPRWVFLNWLADEAAAAQRGGEFEYRSKE